MCESIAYIKDKDGQEQLLLEDVVKLVPRQGKIVITSILGETQELEAEIDHIDLLHHRIILREKG